MWANYREGKSMSLVIGVISNQFAIVCGEGKVTYENNTSADDFKKVFKLNSDTIMGITGDLRALKRFVGDFFYIKDNRFYLKDLPNVRYKDIKEKLDTNFDDILKNNNSENFFVSILGWNNGFCFDSYFYDSESLSFCKRQHTVLDGENDFKFVCMEFMKDRHYKNFLNIVNTCCASNILQIKNAFKSTIDLGVKFDNTINSNCMFESIRKNDIIKKFN